MNVFITKIGVEKVENVMGSHLCGRTQCLHSLIPADEAHKTQALCLNGQ